MIEKNISLDEFLFLEDGRSLFIDCKYKNRMHVDYY